jgi:ribosomal protein L10
MTQVLTPVDVERELLRLCKLLEAATYEFADMAKESAVADAEYKSANARARLQAKGLTVGEKEAEATIATEKEYMRRRVSESIADSQRELCRSLRSQLDAVRSIGANLRSQT